MPNNYPEEITPIYIEAVTMPNGEIIHQGKTLGYVPKNAAPKLSRPNLPVYSLHN